MKITPAQINSFTKNIPNNIKIILLYGVDYGLVKDLTETIKQSFLGLSYNKDAINEFDAINLKKDSSLLQEALYSENLFLQNQKKIITITNCNSTITPIISDLLNNINQDTLLLLLAEELPANSSLRKLAEKEINIATIACYHDSADTIKNYIKTTLVTNGYTIEPEALNWLSNNLGNDRLVTKQEINKLIIYKGDHKNISLENVLEVVSNNSELALNEIIFDITLGNQIKAYSTLQQFLLTSPAIMVIRALNNSFRRLLLAKQLQNENFPINVIANKLTPPVLFLHVEKLKKQLSLWNIGSINNYLSKLTSLELSIKSNPNLSLVLLNKFTLDISLNITANKN